MKHPAKFSDRILDVIREVLNDNFHDEHTILDPFAGTGKIHQLDSGWRHTWGIELEPEWAAMHPRTSCGSALDIWAEDDTVDAIVTSPCYGNRMADKDMRDSVAGTYAKGLGRIASEGSACHLQWGHDYQSFHADAWDEALRVLKPGGLFVLNISDHIRGKRRVPVAAWHMETLQNLGCYIEDVIPVRTPRQRNGANSAARVDAELVIVLRNYNDLMLS